VPLSSATIVYCDNVSAIYMTANPVHHRRTKHIEIDIHFVREKVALGQIRVLHVPSSHQYANIMTKGLPLQLFTDFRDSLGVRLAPPCDCGRVLDRYCCICLVLCLLVLQAIRQYIYERSPPSKGVRCLSISLHKLRRGTISIVKYRSKDTHRSIEESKI